jgi:hypothetical protein
MRGKSLSHAEHFRWMQAVLADPTLTPTQKVVLIRLALHLNLKSGRCDPSIESLAKGAAVKPRAVQAAVARAQKLGRLSRHEGGGRGNTNSYTLLLKEAETGAETLHRGALFGETLHSDAAFAETLHGETVNGDAQKGASPRHKPCTAVHPNTENKKNTDNNEDFDRWYARYPKHRARGKARKAFERIVGAGLATVDELIAGATRYAAERQGQEQRFTKDPATWLNGECWADESLAHFEPAQNEIAAAGGGRVVPRL